MCLLTLVSLILFLIFTGPSIHEKFNGQRLEWLSSNTVQLSKSMYIYKPINVSLGGKCSVCTDICESLWL